LSDEEQGLTAGNAPFKVNKPNIPNSSSSRTPDPIDQQFNEWWELYPRKVGKTAAGAAYRKAIKAGASPPDLLQGLRRQFARVTRDLADVSATP
jgi:hypothetical protein